MTANRKGKVAASISILPYDTNSTRLKNRIELKQNLFSFLLAGEKTVYYAGTSVTIRPNQFILLSAGNCLMSEKVATDDRGYKSLLLSFDNNILADFFVRHPSLLDLNSPTLQETPYLVFEKDSFLENFTASLSHLVAKNDALSIDLQKIKLEELLIYLSEVYPGKIQQLSNLSQGRDKDMLMHLAINASIDQPVTIEELAFLCNSSVSTFKRRFSKVYGTSPNRWLLEKRMQKAAVLLKQGDRTASEIFPEIGYENLSSFIQSFKQVYGITPKQYQLSGGSETTHSRR